MHSGKEQSNNLLLWLSPHPAYLDVRVPKPACLVEAAVLQPEFAHSLATLCGFAVPERATIALVEKTRKCFFFKFHNPHRQQNYSRGKNSTLIWESFKICILKKLQYPGACGVKEEVAVFLLVVHGCHSVLLLDPFAFSIHYSSFK